MGMRTLRLAVAISAAAHAVAVAWVVTHALALPARSEAATTTPVEIVAVDRPVVPPVVPVVVPIDVALADDRPPPVREPAARPPIASRAHGAHTGGEPAIAVPGVGSAGETAPRPPSAPSGLMAMRRGDVPRAALPGGRWDDLDHAPRGTAPEKDLTTGILHESGGGSYESEQGVFVAKVSPDGTVKLTDRPNLNVHVALPSPKALGRSLARWYESDKGPSGAEGDTVMASQIQLHAGPTTDPPATPGSPSADHTKTVIVPVLAGGFDVTDWLMRNHSGDPYASRKLSLLDATRDERVQLGGKHRSERLAHSAQLMRKTLDALWAAPADLAARKRALFELWDDCAEAGDPELVAGGQAARRLVIGFIRAHLPAGGPDAYTPAELAAFARARQSKAPFQPYE
jgi:hypothetical protein